MTFDCHLCAMWQKMVLKIQIIKNENIISVNIHQFCLKN